MDLEVSAFGTGATGLDEENARTGLDDENARSGVDEEKPRSGLEEDVCFGTGTGTELDIAEISAAVALNSSAAELLDLRPFFLEEESLPSEDQPDCSRNHRCPDYDPPAYVSWEVGTGEDSDITGLL